MEMDVAEEQPLSIEFDSMRDADVTNVPAGPGGTDRLHHRRLSADALQDRVSSDSVRHVLDVGNALVAALGHNFGRPELAGELLPRLVTAHRDNPLSTDLPAREHTEETNRGVTDDCDHLAQLHVGRVGAEPAGAHDVRESEQARDQVL